MRTTLTLNHDGGFTAAVCAHAHVVLLVEVQQVNEAVSEKRFVVLLGNRTGFTVLSHFYGHKRYSGISRDVTFCLDMQNQKTDVRA